MIGAKIRTKLVEFLRDERGTVIVEFVLVIPMYVWLVVGMMQYYHAFRAEMIATKASLAVADLISRQNGNITSSFVNGSHEFLKYLTYGDNNPQLRMTVVRQDFDYDHNNAHQHVVWSKATGTIKGMDDNGLKTIADRIPLLYDSERIIYLETWTQYDPLFDLKGWLWMGAGLGNSVKLTRGVAIHPRFAKQICWQADGAPDRDKLC